ncbi:MAG TPA: hypothetical protein VNM91_01710 [Dehalococcoidia bacterium]|nr:hypothetical protein [Dehalococcoidia bacterium]
MDPVAPIDPDAVDIAVFAAVALGVAIVAAGDVCQRWLAPDPMWFFDIDGSFNLVTWFQSSVLAGAALCAAGIALTQANGALRAMWLAVAGGVAFMSLDKSISLHERLGQRLEDALGWSEQGGRLLWQVVYSPFLAALAILLVAVMLVAGRRELLWVTAAIVMMATKLLLEALMFPAIESGMTHELHRTYAFEVLTEESVQALGFGALFASFARLLYVRAGAAVRDDALSPGAIAEAGVAGPAPVAPLPAPRRVRP